MSQPATGNGCFSVFNRMVCAHICGIGVPGHLHYNPVLQANVKNITSDLCTQNWKLISRHGFVCYN